MARSWNLCGGTDLIEACRVIKVKEILFWRWCTWVQDNYSHSFENNWLSRVASLIFNLICISVTTFFWLVKVCCVNGIPCWEMRFTISTCKLTAATRDRLENIFLSSMTYTLSEVKKQILFVESPRCKHITVSKRSMNFLSLSFITWPSLCMGLPLTRLGCVLVLRGKL